MVIKWSVECIPRLCRLLLVHKPQFGCSTVFPIVLGLPLAVNGWFILYALFSPWLVSCQSEWCCSSSFTHQPGKEILPLDKSFPPFPLNSGHIRFKFPRQDIENFLKLIGLHKFTIENVKFW